MILNFDILEKNGEVVLYAVTDRRNLVYCTVDKVSSEIKWQSNTVGNRLNPLNVSKDCLLKVYNDIVYVVYSFAGENGAINCNISITKDQGQTWTTPPTLPGVYTSSMMITDDIIILGNANGESIFSKDNGSTWDRVAYTLNESEVNTIYSLPIENNPILIAGRDGQGAGAFKDHLSDADSFYSFNRGENSFDLLKSDILDIRAPRDASKNAFYFIQQSGISRGITEDDDSGFVIVKWQPSITNIAGYEEIMAVDSISGSLGYSSIEFVSMHLGDREAVSLHYYGVSAGDVALLKAPKVNPYAIYNPRGYVYQKLRLLATKIKDIDLLSVYLDDNGILSMITKVDNLDNDSPDWQKIPSTNL